MITHVLWDMDGLLLDTESVYTKVSQQILDRYGKTFDWSLKKEMMGKKERDAAEVFIARTGIPMTVEQYLKERNEGHASLFPHCRPLPGVRKLVAHLKNHATPMIVATSSHRKAFEIKTQNNRELFDLFGNNVLVGDDPRVKQGKPHPDIFLEAAKIIGASDPSTCLVFEDSESGVLAGLNAGMKVVWVPDTQMELDPILKSRCIEVLTTLEQFVPEKYGLPPFPQ
jgi:pseudouridine-5'-monophosphatase